MAAHIKGFTDNFCKKNTGFDNFLSTKIPMSIGLLNILLCLLLSMLQTIDLHAQSPLEKICSIEVKDATIVEALQQLSKKTNTNIAFSKRFFSTQKRLSFSAKNEPLQAVLKRILASTSVHFKAQGQQIILYRDRQTIEKYTLHGYLRDKDLGESLVAATVYCPELQKGAISNEYGYYSLNLPEGEHQLIYNYVGKKDIQQEVALTKDQRLDIELPSEDYLSEILITPNSDSDLQLANISFREGQIQNLSINAPGLGGEPDLMQTVRSMAGVQSGAGGIGGYYVRGGSNGQNLILMDGVPVYNAAHMLGIYSIFNPKAARSVQVYKSGFSAKHSGSLSSVIDIQTREGNANEWSTEIGVNPQSVQLTTEGPIFNKTGSVLLAARHSTFGGFIRPIIEDSFYPNGADFIQTKYFDINLKMNKTLGERDRLYWSIYMGGDKILGENELEYYYYDEEFDMEYLELETEDNELRWGNTISSLRWNHQFNPKLFINTSLIYSRYFNDYDQLFQYYDVEISEDEPYDFYYYFVTSSNKEYTLKTDVDFYPNSNHQIRAGASVRLHSFSPFMTLYDENTVGLPTTDSLSLEYFDDVVEVPIINAQQLDVYLEDKITLSRKWQLTLGLHQSAFFTENQSYSNLEPRFKSDFAVSPKLTFSTSVSRMVQYLHLIATSEFNIPTDFWIPSDEFYEPQTAWQYDAGLYIGLSKSTNLSLNAYYKKMNNITAIPELLFEEDFNEGLGEDDFLTENGESYGLEASVNKNEGKLQFSLGYTLNWANRQSNSVNLGRAYPFQFDRRHELKGVFTYEWNKHFLMGFQGYLGAGHPKLVSWENNFDQGLAPININQPGEKNTTRGSWQHRMDLSLMYRWESKKIKHQLKVSAYNVYNKRNPMFYYLLNDDPNPTNPDLKSNFSMSFIPSFHYSLAF
ncbi:MAG: carboxypeptidase-like regulatory domain-containing protein [Chitinophagales bacterium]